MSAEEQPLVRLMKCLVGQSETVHNHLRGAGLRGRRPHSGPDLTSFRADTRRGLKTKPTFIPTMQIVASVYV